MGKNISQDSAFQQPTKTVAVATTGEQGSGAPRIHVFYGVVFACLSL
jgi:hypothetical protein